MQSSEHIFILRITDIESEFSAEQWKRALLDAIDDGLFERGYDSSYRDLLMEGIKW